MLMLMLEMMMMMLMSGGDDEYVRDEEKDQVALMLFHYVTFLCFDVPLDGPSVWTLSSK